ncbi:FIG00387915: hypothetical protein [hydrothermal vent metagenome]|uniref:Ferrochelatase n=1 Tax=hydrothermal vent metagenome TaxID=652676 RepID=A0A1W1CT44_9ZZZZ
MRLENTIALINGELLNSPFINNFTNIILEPKAVRRGDLFIAFEEKAIDEAIANGAYGIIFDKPTKIRDSEIAWIQVKSVENALIRLLRFELLNKDITVYSCDEITLKLAMQIVSDATFIPLYGNIKTIFKNLIHIQEHHTLLFSPALTTADIFTQTKELPKSLHNNIKIIEHTLFETSFIYNDIFYDRQFISPLFIPHLDALLSLFTQLKINFRLKKFTSIDNFEAVFTNKNFEIKEFGTSDKVLIFEKSIPLVENEINFLNKNATWAKTIYIVPQEMQKNLSKEILTIENLFFYHSKEEIKEILKRNIFHFAFVAGVDKSILDKPLIQQTQLTLDFS